MNIAFFLAPKEELVYESIDSTMRQALEKMEYHRYTAIPLIDKRGKYVGTLTEGDLLWKLKNIADKNYIDTSKIYVRDIERRRDNMAVKITSNIEDLFALIVTQNFVPVVDDNDVFIGMIKRSDILEYYNKKLIDSGLI